MFSNKLFKKLISMFPNKLNLDLSFNKIDIYFFILLLMFPNNILIFYTTIHVSKQNIINLVSKQYKILDLIFLMISNNFLYNYLDKLDD